MLRVNEPITSVKGIGPKKQESLNQKGIYTIHDLLNTYPSTYKDRGQIKVISSAEEKEKVLTFGKYLGGGHTNYINRKLNITILPFQSEDTSFQVIYYNQPFRKTNFIENTEYILYGTVAIKNGVFNLLSPESERKDRIMYLKEGLYPIYPLRIKHINQKQLICYIQYAIENTTFADSIPKWMSKMFDLPTRMEAYRAIHLIDDKVNDLNVGMRYFRFMRFMRFLATIQSLKTDPQQDNGHIFKTDQLQTFINMFDFSLTKAQTNAVKEIKTDITSGKRMNRLLQGDVGSGKTAVALCAVFMSARSSFQSVFTAPTEILAKQHYQKHKARFERFGFRCVLLHSSMKTAEKKTILKQIKSGEADIIFGTHALFSENVIYHNLSMIVIDEQHRFGVAQRAVLEEKGYKPHVLVMSATPIPRTLALSVYQDLDISALNEYPKGRKKIKTIIANSSADDRIYSFIMKEAEKKRKTFIVCPAIEDETMQNVSDLYADLKERLTPYPVACLTGAMSDNEKDEIMNEFAFGKTMILIATTVVEVGIDIPDATVILIKDSERYGLAQLHQLRGRVGRSNMQSYCILQTDTTSEKSLERLRILERSTDGFEIAEADMRLRGSGELYGLQQSGKSNGIIFEALEHPDFFKNVQDCFQKLLVSKDKDDKKFLDMLMEQTFDKAENIVLN